MNTRLPLDTTDVLAASPYTLRLMTRMLDLGQVRRDLVAQAAGRRVPQRQAVDYLLRMITR
jgi:hypothetical protein